ncbi:MAG: helix-turn-helix domain-containing protein [Aminivibrio sp.]|jgi:transcriptional regulator with XRE-family HTH domain
MAKKFNDLVASLPQEDQDEIRRRTEALSASIKLEEIRKARRISQKMLASAMRVSQPAISKMENESNMTVKTLSAFASGLGGKVRIEIEFPDGVSYKVL